MKTKKELGAWGEGLAAEYLLKAGYKIVARNWHFGKEEIDIIARMGDVLVIVEVKARENDAFGNPEEFVSNGQQKRLINAAEAYVLERDLDVNVRFDIIAILGNDEKHSLTHFDDAFYPTL